ncbi:MAG TPA: DUF4383 domain-containing protein [Candidatus Saccharimonadales bacterium]|nr:DUF4383 domain-containing protein [Candidatus Saccharimonadales bacterium]
MAKKVTLALGVLLLFIGVLGFVPAVTPFGPNGMAYLFSLFLVDPIQNIVHIAAGVVGLLASSSHRYSRWFLQVAGIAYAVMAIAGFVQNDTVVGLFGVSIGTNALHALLAAGMLVIGFSPQGTTPEARLSAPKPPSKTAM